MTPFESAWRYADSARRAAAATPPGLAHTAAVLEWVGAVFDLIDAMEAS